MRKLQLVAWPGVSEGFCSMGHFYKISIICNLLKLFFFDSEIQNSSANLQEKWAHPCPLRCHICAIDGKVVFCEWTVNIWLNA